MTIEEGWSREALKDAIASKFFIDMGRLSLKIEAELSGSPTDTPKKRLKKKRVKS